MDIELKVIYHSNLLLCDIFLLFSVFTIMIRLYGNVLIWLELSYVSTVNILRTLRPTVNYDGNILNNDLFIYIILFYITYNDNGNQL